MTIVCGLCVALPCRPALQTSSALPASESIRAPTSATKNKYVAGHNIIVNPLHEQGFSTISCNRCTTSALPNEPKRAGRWRHLGPWSVYCGINPTDLAGGTSLAIDIPQELIDRLLGRTTDFSI